MALKDILTNAKYADDLVLTLPDNTTMTVGEMRQMSTAEKQMLQERSKTVEQAEAAIAARVMELQRAGLLTAEGAPVPNPTERQMRHAVAEEYGVDENDAIVGPVVKEMKKQLAERDQQFKAFQENTKKTLETVTSVVRTAVEANLEERYHTDFDRAVAALPEKVRGKVDYEKAYKFADENKLKDRFGRLDLSQAIDRMTWNDVKEAEKAALEASVTADLEKKNRMAQATRPRMAGPEHTRQQTDFNPTVEETTARGRKIERAKTFDEALAEAQSDDALMQSALSAASFGISQ